MKINLRYLFSVLLLVSSGMVAAQSFNPPEEGVNENSLRPVHPSDVMFKKAVWRRINLLEKQNKGFFAKGNEISKILLDAVKRGDIKPYSNDSLTTRLSLEEFAERLQNPELVQDPADAAFGADDSGFGNEGQQEVVANTDFLVSDCSILDLKEDLIFDKQRSRIYFDIQAVAVVIPSDKHPSGLDKEVCWLSYKEVVMNVFSKDKSAIWYNRQNSAEHRTLADAFELRLFGSKITKVANPDNLMLQDIYGEALLSTYKAEADLMEFEHNLWEY